MRAVWPVIWSGRVQSTTSTLIVARQRGTLVEISDHNVLGRTTVLVTLNELAGILAARRITGAWLTPEPHVSGGEH